jgi:hypothetical protein
LIDAMERIGPEVHDPDLLEFTLREAQVVRKRRS